jgi:hypothetical protein
MHTAAGEIVMTGQNWFLKTDTAGAVTASTTFSDVDFKTIDSRDPQKFVLSGDMLSTNNAVILSTNALGQGCQDSLLVLTTTPRNIADSLLPSTMALPLQNFVFNLFFATKTVQINDDCGKKSTAIDEAAALNEVHLFPNPATESITVQSSEYMKRVAVFSSNGSLVQQQILHSQNYQLDVRTLPAGLYVITIETDKSIESVRFVVQ